MRRMIMQRTNDSRIIDLFLSIRNCVNFRDFLSRETQHQHHNTNCHYFGFAYSAFMARTFLIIDGYNLMHAAGLARRSYGPGGFERSRIQFLKQLSNYLDDTAAADAIVVFDSGQNSAGEQQQESNSRIKILYSQDSLDADSEIERILNSHSSPRQVLVVSSDHRLHKSARRRRARCIDSEDFWNLLIAGQSIEHPAASRTRKTNPSKSSPDHPTPPIDDDMLLDFLNIDVSEIKRSVRKEDR